MSNRAIGILSLLILTLGFKTSFSQISTDDLVGQVNTITTAVPFLMIAPDARSGGMGDAGVALSPDANSMSYNPAKYAFVQKDMGFSISYVPWLRNLIDDINLAYVSGFMRLDKKQTVAASLRYFALGNITFTDITGNTIGNFNPNEFAFDVAYSRLLSRKLSGGIALRFIYSNLTGGQYVGGTESQPGKAFAADVSVYYEDKINLFDKSGKLAIGSNISNIGSKISYTDNADKDFIPVNLKLGSAVTVNIDDYNSLCFTAELNKLLVPTPPAFFIDPITGDTTRYGKVSDVSVVTGIFQSFNDAPGGSKEEFKEINYSLGAEYWYAKQFAIRGGYFHEPATKGNRKFFTLGMGLKLNVFGVDFAYLIPTSGTNSPLANTLRFTIHFDMEQLGVQNSKSKTAQ
jgi:hypothetical protein